MRVRSERFVRSKMEDRLCGGRNVLLREAVSSGVGVGGIVVAVGSRDLLGERERRHRSSVLLLVSTFVSYSLS